MQLTPGEGRLEYVGGVHRPFRCSCANDGVYLVDEQDAVAGALYLFDYFLQPFFKLSPVLGAGNQSTHVQSDQSLTLKGFRDIAGTDALCQCLNDGGLANTGLSHQNGIVLGTPAENLHYALNLFLPADHGVEFVVPGGHGEVHAQLV